MSQEKQIENQSPSIISKLINERNGEKFSSIIQIFTFAINACSESAKVEKVDFKQLPVEEQIDILEDLIHRIYSIVHKNKLVSESLDLQIQKLFSSETNLKMKISEAIKTYDATSEIFGLPSRGSIVKGLMKK
jgi:hypothetical protein